MEVAKLPEGASCQLIGGEIIMAPAPDLFHQAVSRNIFLQLTAFVAERNLGELFYAPVDVYLSQHDMDVFKARGLGAERSALRSFIRT